jgi:hypothetical protein
LISIQLENNTSIHIASKPFCLLAIAPNHPEKMPTTAFELYEARMDALHALGILHEASSSFGALRVGQKASKEAGFAVLKIAWELLPIFRGSSVDDTAEAINDFLMRDSLEKNDIHEDEVEIDDVFELVRAQERDIEKARQLLMDAALPYERHIRPLATAWTVQMTAEKFFRVRFGSFLFLFLGCFFPSLLLLFFFFVWAFISCHHSLIQNWYFV